MFGRKNKLIQELRQSVHDLWEEKGLEKKRRLAAELEVIKNKERHEIREAERRSALREAADAREERQAAQSTVSDFKDRLDRIQGILEGTADEPNAAFCATIAGAMGIPNSTPEDILRHAEKYRKLRAERAEAKREAERKLRTTNRG
jgi:hypothetical protein